MILIGLTGVVSKMTSTHSIRILIFSASLLIAALMSARAHAENRFDVVHSLQAWQQHTSVREDLEDREKDLRLQFIQRLIFQTERKYQEDSLKEFYIQTLNEMVQTDEHLSNRSFGRTTAFLEGLSASLDELLEKNENVITFIETFTDYSGIQEPVSVSEFAETRSYFNGKSMMSATEPDLNATAASIDQIEKTKDLTPQELRWFRFQENLILDFTPEQPSAFDFHQIPRS
jgi:hypothetical protein